ASVDEGMMLSDIHGDSAYRANLVKVMAKRAVAAAG
ncbi:MAG: carbon monoxide dehydrogenase, partial [Nitratireductor sp.]|nr:carbon monoxide dehydrogenase [Nitratireductor sp.]